MANTRKTARGILMGLAVAIVAAVGGLGWTWAAGLTVDELDVSGLHYADREAVLELTHLDTGMVLLDVEPYLVEDRIRRHPWVRDARVLRLPTGTVAIHVEERVPLALLLDAEGRPSHYLDPEGAGMPIAPGFAENVPLLRGIGAPHPMQVVAHPTVRHLLGALATADAATDALISEIEMKPDGEAWLYTAPAGARGAITVRLGRGPFEEKLERLRAFWHQAVLAQPEKSYELIDLRFNSQIVTRESGTDA